MRRIPESSGAGAASASFIWTTMAMMAEAAPA